jgi:hypothetical protein
MPPLTVNPKPSLGIHDLIFHHTAPRYRKAIFNLHRHRRDLRLLQCDLDDPGLLPA